MNAHWALKYIGLPYEEKGRGPDAYDCWGLIREIYHNELEIELPSYTDEYTKTVSTSVVKLFIRESAKWMKIDDEREFDIVLINQKGHPLHVGLIMGSGIMLHTMNNTNVCQERYRNALWKPKINGFYRFKH